VQSSHLQAAGDQPPLANSQLIVGRDPSVRDFRRSATEPLNASAASSLGIRRTASNLVREAQSASTRSLISSHPSFRSVAETFRCPICLENVDVSERVVFRKCGDVAHSHCRGCIGQYARGLIDDGRVSSIRCPHDKCKALASQEEIEAWTDKDILDKYVRFTRMRQDPELRQCARSGCGTLCRPLHNADGEIVAEMKCEKCGQEFCYYHSNAHEGASCDAYRLEIARAERLQSTILEGTRPCPSCGITTDKISGCNHMTCATCGSDWCWMCGEAITNIGWHYSPSNPNGCAQFGDDISSGRSMKCLRICLLPVSILTLILLVPCVLILLLVSPVICFAMVLPRGVDEVVICCFVVAFLPMILFQILWAILCIPAICLMCLCGASEDRIQFVVMLPGNTVIACMELGGAADNEADIPELASFSAGHDEP